MKRSEICSGTELSYSGEILLNSIREVCRKATGRDFDSMKEIGAHSSERRIFRITVNGDTMVAVLNDNITENIAYVSFTESFLKAGIKVPEVYAVSDDQRAYLVKDLGDVTLNTASAKADKQEMLLWYERALHDLAELQCAGKNTVDFSKCIISPDFNGRIIGSDLNKFSEYFFSGIVGVGIEAKELAEIKNLFELIVKRNSHGYFMFRDFQTRNIMLHDNKLFYIDFQSGMRGPSQYDLASFLFSGSISLDEKERVYLCGTYCKAFEDLSGISEDEMKEDLPEIIFLRMIQVIGSYAFVHSKKRDQSLLTKIPRAVSNIIGLTNDLRDSKLRALAVRIADATERNYS